MKLSILLAAALLAVGPFVSAGHAVEMPPAIPNLISNGSFETDANADGSPDDWSSASGPLSYETENGNRFARLKSQQPGQTAIIYRLVPIPKEYRALKLTWKQRISDLKLGKESWFDARIMMDWRDTDNKKMGGSPSAPSFRSNISNWEEKTTQFLVPANAATLEFMPALLQVQSGVYDLDDFVLQPIDPAPLEAAAREWAAKKAAEDARAIAARDAEINKTLVAEGSLMPNGDFQADKNGDGYPDTWDKPNENSGMTFETEGENRFLRLKALEAGKTTLFYRPVMLPSTVRALEISWRQRISDLVPGKESWLDARVMSDFINTKYAKFKGGPTLDSSRYNTKDWVEKKRSILVPEGAAGIALMPALLEVKSGTYDLDDFVVKPTDAAPLIAAAEKAAAEDKRINLAPEAPNPAKFPSELHVVGNKILTKEGKEVWLQGVNVMSLDWNPQGERMLLNTKVAIEEWKANTIRLPVNDRYWFGKDTNQKDGGKAYRELVDAVVNMAANRGAYVILDLHQYRAPTAEHVEFWKDAAARYKNHPALIFDLLNEPHGISWEVWRDGGLVPVKEGVDEAAFLSEAEKIKNKVAFRSVGMQALLDAVRSTGAKNLVLAGGLDYGYDLSGITKGFVLTDKDGNGIIYGSHIYPWKNDYQKKILDIVDKYPVLFGENGGNTKKVTFIPQDQQEDVAVWVPRFLGIVQKYKIHWTAFSFHPSATPILISDWNYTPTPEWGALAKRALAGEQFPFIGLR